MYLSSNCVHCHCLFIEVGRWQSERLDVDRIPHLSRVEHEVIKRGSMLDGSCGVRGQLTFLSHLASPGIATCMSSTVMLHIHATEHVLCSHMRFATSEGGGYNDSTHLQCCQAPLWGKIHMWHAISFICALR